MYVRHVPLANNLFILSLVHTNCDCRQFQRLLTCNGRLGQWAQASRLLLFSVDCRHVSLFPWSIYTTTGSLRVKSVRLLDSDRLTDGLTWVETCSFRIKSIFPTLSGGAIAPIACPASATEWKWRPMLGQWHVDLGYYLDGWPPGNTGRCEPRSVIRRWRLESVSDHLYRPIAVIELTRTYIDQTKTSQTTHWIHCCQHLDLLPFNVVSVHSIGLYNCKDMLRSVNLIQFINLYRSFCISIQLNSL